MKPWGYAEVESQVDFFNRRKRLIKRIDGVKARGLDESFVKRAIEENVGDGCAAHRPCVSARWARVFCSAGQVAGSREGAPLGKDTIAESTAMILGCGRPSYF